MDDGADRHVDAAAQVADRVQRVEVGVCRDVDLEVGVGVVVGPRARPAFESEQVVELFERPGAVAVADPVDLGEGDGEQVRRVVFAQLQFVYGATGQRQHLTVGVRRLVPPGGERPLVRRIRLEDVGIAFLRGVERHPIAFEKQGKSVSVSIEGLLDHEVVGVDSLSAPGECIALDNTGHPVNKRLNLASAVRSVIHAFGIDWEAEPGRANGHFAPFSWQGETV